MSTETQRVELSIPMLSEMELAAARTAEAVAEFMKLDGDQMDETAMALIEACLYTFQEGVSGRRAHICFYPWEDRLEIYLHALGEDFDPEELPRRQAEVKPLPEGRKSWGLKIMAALMDRAEVIRLPEGPLIRMVKYRSR